MTLRKRLSLATALVVLVTVSALAVAAYAIAGHELRSQVDDTLATRADAIVRQIDRDLQRPRFPGRQQVPLGPTLLQPEFDAITQVIDVDGSILAVLGPAELPVTDAVLVMAGSRVAGRSARQQAVRDQLLERRILLDPGAGPPRGVTRIEQERQVGRGVAAEALK